MKHASNPRRGRGRNNGKRNQNSRNRNFESNSSDTKVRGTAQQVLDKYLALARDATAAGDRIAAEGYYQHAEHYHRILNPEGGQNNNQHERKRPHNEGSNRRDEGRAKSDSQPEDSKQVETAQPAPEPAQEAAEPVQKPAAPVEKAVEEKPQVEASEEKPRRRGRPRKVEISEPDSEDDKASESAA